MSNIFYSEVDPAVQLELNARGNVGKNRTTADINFMVGKIANVQLTAYKSGSADPGTEVGFLGGSDVTVGRYLPSGPNGFLMNSKYTVTTLNLDQPIVTSSTSSVDDNSRRIGPIITAVSVDIGDHSMGLLNKASVNITIPNPTRDLDQVESIWFYPGRYVKIDIVHPNSAIITGADTNLISTSSLFGSLPENIVNEKLTKMYPSLGPSLTEFKRKIRKLNEFSFQGLITSFDFSYNEDASVSATISLTGTSNTYTDVTMLMNPKIDKDKKTTTLGYNTVATKSIAELEALQAAGYDTGSTEFYGYIYKEFEETKTKFLKDYNIETSNQELLIPFADISDTASDRFMLYGQMFPNVQFSIQPFPTSSFVLDPSSSLTPQQQQDQFNQQQQQDEDSYNKAWQPYIDTQRYITLGSLIDLINQYVVSKIEGSATGATIFCVDDAQFSNYYSRLTSCIPKDILLLPNQTTNNLDEAANSSMNVYGGITMYGTIVENMSKYTNVKQWPGISDGTKVYTSRIFINLQYIQKVLNSLSENNTRSFTLTSFLANISNRISYATGNAIVLKLVTDPDNPNNLLFADSKYLKPMVGSKPVEPYSVPMLANHDNGTIVQEFTFQAKLPSNVKNLSYVLNSGTDVSDDEIAPHLNFMYNSKDPDAINAARAKYKAKHEEILKNLTDAKIAYGDKPFVQETTTSLTKALIEYVKYPFSDITKAQQLTAPIFPFDVDFTIDGINGLRYGDVLTFEGLPEKYRTNTVFSIIGITHDVDTAGVWKSKVKCIMRPKLG